MNPSTRTLLLVGALLLVAKRTAPKKLTLAELRALAASVGFPNPDLAAAVAMAESGGDPAAIGDRDKGGSYGLWQIHTPAHPEFTAASMMVPGMNALAALKISQGGTNWGPWSTFTSGAYKRYLKGGSA